MDSTQVKIDIVKKQLGALRCEKFRITLKNRREGLFGQIYGNKSAKQRGAGEIERFFSIDDICERIRDLELQNMRGFDIYVTPISDIYHHILIDDATADTVRELVDEGYRPAMAQESSIKNECMNYQLVLIVNKIEVSEAEQSIANKVVMAINQKFGDPKMTGVRRPFRMAGFANKKEGKNDFFTRLISDSGNLCEKADQELAQLRADKAEQQAKLSKPQVRYNKGLGVLPVADDVAVEAYKRQWQVEARIALERYKTIEAHRIDWRTMQSLRALGYTDDQIQFANTVFRKDRNKVRKSLLSSAVTK